MASTVAGYSASNQAVATTSHPIALPTHAQTNLLLAGIRYNATNIGIVDPSGWTVLMAVVSGSSATRIYGKLAGPTTETCTGTSATAKSAAWAVCITGHGVVTVSSDVDIAYDLASSNQTAPNPPSLTGFNPGADLFMAGFSYITGGTAGSSVTAYPYNTPPLTNHWVTDTGDATITSSTLAVAISVFEGTKADPEDTGNFAISGTQKQCSAWRLSVAAAAPTIGPKATVMRLMRMND